MSDVTDISIGVRKCEVAMLAILNLHSSQINCSVRKVKLSLYLTKHHAMKICWDNHYNYLYGEISRWHKPLCISCL